MRNAIYACSTNMGGCILWPEMHAIKVKQILMCTFYYNTAYSSQ